MKWSVYKLDGKGRGARGTSLGTIEAAGKTDAVVAAVDKFRHLGVSVANVEVKEKQPEY